MNSAFHLVSQELNLNLIYSGGDFWRKNSSGKFEQPTLNSGRASKIATEFLNSSVNGGSSALTNDGADALENLMYGLTIHENSGHATVDTSNISSHNRVSARNVMFLLATLSSHSLAEPNLQFDCAVGCSEAVRELAGRGSKRSRKSTKATKDAGQGTVSGWG